MTWIDFYGTVHNTVHVPCTVCEIVNWPFIYMYMYVQHNSTVYMYTHVHVYVIPSILLYCTCWVIWASLFLKAFFASSSSSTCWLRCSNSSSACLSLLRAATLRRLSSLRFSYNNVLWIHVWYNVNKYTCTCICMYHMYIVHCIL